MLLINCEVSLILTWSENCALSTQDDNKLLEQMKTNLKEQLNGIHTGQT